MSRDLSVGIPKIIWILWLQGFDAAPDLVKKCLLSWQRHNPGWRIVLLDEKNIKDHLNLDDIIRHNRHTISMQALANIVRINLLAKFGGVWVDSTCFCCRPLDEWIGNHLTSGFFAFEKPGKDRLISNWFLASGKNCHLTNTFCEAVNAYWSRNRFPYQKGRAGQKIIRWMGKILNRNARLAGLWVHPLTAKLFRLHPYHWQHYLFYRVVTTDEHSGKLWRQTPKISADIPHRLLIAGLLKPASAGIKAAIDSRKDPLYKLNWRCDKSLVPGCTLDYLLNSANTEGPVQPVPGMCVNRTRKGVTLWFFGLPSSGKSTLAGKVVEQSDGYVLLDGDEVRTTVTNFNMDYNARLMHLSYMAYCCRQLNACGINVAAAFVTPLECHRQRIKEILNDVKFIWLQCAPAACAARDPKGLWKKAASGALPQLTGAGGDWEDPTDSELTIRTDAMSVDQSFAALKTHFDLIEQGD